MKINFTKSMGDLPDAVRTHYMKSGDRENVLLAQLLLLKGDHANLQFSTKR
jgi:hypothetical protein